MGMAVCGQGAWALGCQQPRRCPPESQRAAAACSCLKMQIWTFVPISISFGWVFQSEFVLLFHLGYSDGFCIGLCSLASEATDVQSWLCPASPPCH